MDRKRLMVAGGLVVLMGAVFVGLNGMQEPPAPVIAPEKEVIVEKVEYSQVLGVVDPMTKGSRVSASQLTWMDWPTEAVTAALIVRDETADIDPTESLDGSILRDNVQPGEPLTYGRFIRAGEAGIMAALLKPGMRATTIRISVDTASGGFIQPGDRVDVILKEVLPSKPTSEGGTGRSIVTAKTVFENVLVLAIDQSFTNEPGAGAALPGSTATLELSRQDSESIIIAQDRGDLILTLRGFSGADARARSRAANITPDPVAPSPLQVFRRGEVETVQLQQR